MSIVSSIWLLTCLTSALMATGNSPGVISGLDANGAAAIGAPVAAISLPATGHDEELPELPIVAPRTGPQPPANSAGAQSTASPCVCLPGSCRLRTTVSNVIPMLPIGRQLFRPNDSLAPDASTCSDGSCRLR